LRLDTQAGLTKPLGDFHLLFPGDPEQSELYLRTVEPDEEERMPPPEAGPALTTAEIDVLRRWIEQGAKWSSHWAYAPLSKDNPPAVDAAEWVRNPLDRFVLAQLEAREIAPAPEADRNTLLRRVTLDLIGMVPTHEELEAYLEDDSEYAYEHVVDRLLASPHYAERWARHWLDLARYADSHGFTIDGGRSMWPYRDWVIDAIDRDMPFDQFSIEQLAGDMLPSPSNSQLVATGFHRNTQINQEGGAKDEEFRVNAVIDRVDTTGTVWLGATLGCARCHSHKYDPITQVEYFKLFSFFNQTEDGGVTSEPSVQVTDEQTSPALGEFEGRRAVLVRELEAARAADSHGWTAWTPLRARGSNGPELRIGQDASIRSLGQNPQTSDYVLEGIAPVTGIASLRLEALPHASLPRGGPGRSGSGNFVLERIRLLGRRADLSPGGSFEEIPLQAAQASYSQGFGPEGGNPYPVAEALRAEARKGWAVSPRVGTPHVAHFELAQPLAPGDWELQVVLQQNWGSNHVLGRFRIAFSARTDLTASVSDSWAQAWTAVAEHDRLKPKLPSSLVMRERSLARPNYLFKRGNYLDPGAPVVPGFPTAMNGFAAQQTPKTRLDLARWLVDPSNALAQRVTVNRWWQHLFGLGLVATENDFGIRGARPSHPALLDWLAQEFVNLGLSRKALLRLIVTSATYRQSSRLRPELTQADPRNQWMARQNRHRMEAESIRDSALRASGLLSTKMGGPPIQPPQPDGVFAFTQSKKSWHPSEGTERFRRTLYVRLWRSSTFPFLTTFDAPVANVSCTRRERSSTPLQALTMANDPMLLEIAAGLGARLQAAEEDGQDGIQLGFLACLGRLGTQEEQALLTQHRLSQYQRQTESGANPSAAQLHAWTAVARVLFNLDEFLTRS
ncbi:MAG: hypothetical protein ACI9F9_002558, partial [Candidatus Paceibacteria bacterium]